MTSDRHIRSTRSGYAGRGCGHRGGLLTSVRMPMMMMPIVACGCSRRRAEQIIQNVNDGADVPLRPTVSILESWVQSATERAGVDALTVMMHTLYYRALPTSRVLLRGELLQLLRKIPGSFGECAGVESGRLGR